jgi:hypothetical protein
MEMRTLMIPTAAAGMPNGTCQIESVQKPMIISAVK